jgi:hypothetical protein
MSSIPTLQPSATTTDAVRSSSPSPQKSAGMLSHTLPCTPERQKGDDQLLSSPAQVLSPMAYHDYDRILSVKERELTKTLRNRPVHSLAPQTIERQVRVIKTHYDKIRAAKKAKLDHEGVDKSEGNTQVIQAEDATIHVVDDGILVEQSGRRRLFGLHETLAKDKQTKRLKRQVRMYPISGTGICRLSGPLALALIRQHKQRPISPNFQQVVMASIKAGQANIGSESSLQLSVTRSSD